MNLSPSVCETLHLNQKESASFREQGVFLLNPEGQLRVAVGPFLGSKTPGSDSIYLPGFFGRENAFIYPAKTLRLSLAEWKYSAEALPVEPVWDEPDEEFFNWQVAEAKSRFKASELKKVVPVVRWKSSWRPTADQIFALMQALFQTARRSKSPAYTYGYWNGHRGFLGRTPEILFKLQERKLRTMALAGTSWPGKDIELMNDPKERDEHQWVVREILESLGTLGEFAAEPLQQLQAGELTHLFTPIKGRLNSVLPMENLCQKLHPTPALGGYPQKLAKAWLKVQPEAEWREDFGAPLAWEKEDTRETECVVLIRGLFWNVRESFIATGCGIVADSEAQKEWLELKKKKDSILRSFGW